VSPERRPRLRCLRRYYPSHRGHAHLHRLPTSSIRVIYPSHPSESSIGVKSEPTRPSESSVPAPQATRALYWTARTEWAALEAHLDAVDELRRRIAAALRPPPVILGALSCVGLRGGPTDADREGMAAAVAELCGAAEAGAAVAVTRVTAFGAASCAVDFAVNFPRGTPDAAVGAAALALSRGGAGPGLDKALRERGVAVGRATLADNPVVTVRDVFGDDDGGGGGEGGEDRPALRTDEELQQLARMQVRGGPVGPRPLVPPSPPFGYRSFCDG
jgi:hypothetical protein